MNVLQVLLNGIKGDVFVRSDVHSFLQFFPFLEGDSSPKSPAEGTDERAVEAVSNRRKQYFDADIQVLLSKVPTQENECEVLFRIHVYM